MLHQSLDIYSLGLVFWSLLAAAAPAAPAYAAPPTSPGSSPGSPGSAGPIPFPHLASEEVPPLVMAGARPLLLPDMCSPLRGSAVLCSMVRACWAANPQARPAAKDLVHRLTTALEEDR